MFGVPACARAVGTHDWVSKAAPDLCVLYSPAAFVGGAAAQLWVKEEVQRMDMHVSFW